MITINHLQSKYTLNEEFFRECFWQEYRNLTGKNFDPSANGGEAGQFLNTVIDYYLEKDSFLESPLLKGDNHNLRKGLMIVGPTGTSKTSVMLALSRLSRNPKILFRYNPANPSESSSILQTLQFARRERGSCEIKFATADDVVTEY
ncbi:hypothetical protein, partial [Kaistella sp.]|uniref:hypothetical protein n=1 Tax=Kaistella sp. TaxID=2782235 RepID=UPI002F945AAD